MKLAELKCDICVEKTKDTSNSNNTNVNENHNLNNSTVSDQSESLSASSSASSSASKGQVVVSKCLDCNSFMCAACFVDHQNISSFGSHQMVSLNNISVKETENENDESLSEQRKQPVNQLNSSVNSQKQLSQSSGQPKVQGPVNNQNQISNLQQLQQQFNNLEDQLRVKNKQQQQQPLMMNNVQQQQQNARLLQIENEIQKSYNFYTQMLKERKDYLINELNTIVQFAVLNHTQNYNKQLKLKSELEQKRANLELSESFLSSDPSKVSPLNHDLNNNKINSNLAELNNLTLINDQIINQIKSNNPLQQIEFVSNYSAIQTSIRNTFGYIRINNQINAQQLQQQQQQLHHYQQQPQQQSNVNQQQQQQQSKQDMNFNSEQLARANLNNPASVYDYLTQMSKSQNQRSKMAQSELYIDLESSQNQQFGNLINNSSSKTSGFNASTNNNGNTEVGFENKYDYFGQPINTFSGSSSGSSKSVGSSSVSSFNNQNNTIQRSEQRPIGSSHSSYETSSTSPISISTDNLTVNSCLPSNSSNASSNYFLDQFSSRDWSSTNGISDLIQKSKSLDAESDGANNQLEDDFFNSTMVKSKSSWSSLINNDNNNNDNKTVESMSSKSESQMFSPYFDSNKNDQSPTLAALLNGHKNGPVGGLNKFNNHAITLSAGSTKSSSSSSHSGNYFQNNANNKHMMTSEDQLHLSSNNSNNNTGGKIMSAVSSTSASPDDRISSLSSSASSACSDSNYHDSSLATLKSVMKSTSNTNSLMSNLGHSGNARSSLLDQHSIANNVNANANSTNLAVGSSTRSQLRRSKMIYHCKFGEFGINDGQFTEPSGVTINNNNDIIVADTNSHRIQIFDKDGRFKFKFGECGKRDGQLLYPNRVSVVKHTGDIVVTERSPTHQIQIYNKYGQFLRKFGANILQHPRGVCVDNKGRIIVVECKVMRVLIFDLMGNVLQKFNCSKYLEFPNGVCCSSGLDREEIYISDNRAHCIKVFDYNGNFIRQIGGEGVTNYPIGVGINSNNEILVADNHNNFNLTVFNQDGTLINALESKVKHAQCFDVGLMDDGSIVLASKDYRIYVYKYVNNNLTLSSSYTNENNQLLGNDNLSNDFKFEQRDIMHNEQEQLYDLFSPQINDLTNYNQLMGLAGNNQLGNLNNQSFAKSSESLLDNLNFNCLMSN